MSLKIAFAGTPAFAVPALEALLASDHRVVGVLTQPDRPAGRGRQSAASAVKLRAQQDGVPIAQPEQLRTAEQQAPLREWQPDLLVVVAYGLILPQAVLDLPRYGCLNIHASLLPRWRGAAPIQRAILNGDAETGVCIMHLEAGLDTGPVYARRSVPIGPRTTAADLHQQLAQLGATELLQTIAQIDAGTARAVPQPAEGISHAAKVTKAEARIDWRNDAAHISRQVRAFNPRPVAETSCEGAQLRIWMAHSLDDEAAGQSPGTVLGLRDGAVQVACGRGALAVESLQLAGRRMVGAADFANSRSLQELHFE